jgi:hypothetical protein
VFDCILLFVLCEISYFSIFRKSVDKLQVSLKSRSVLLTIKLFHTKFNRQSKHTFMLNNFFFFENRAVCEIMWKNNVVPGRPQMAIWRMHIAYWIPKATNTYSEYVTLVFHCNSCSTNSPQCYNVRVPSLPVFVQRQEQITARDSRRLDLPSCSLKQLLFTRHL